MGNHESFPTDFHGDSYDSYVVPIAFPHRLCQDTDPHHGDGDHAIVLIGEEDLGQKLHHIRVLLVSKCRLKVPDVGEIHPFPKGFKIGSQSWPSFSYKILQTIGKIKSMWYRMISQHWRRQNAHFLAPFSPHLSLGVVPLGCTSCDATGEASAMNSLELYPKLTLLGGKMRILATSFWGCNQHVFLHFGGYYIYTIICLYINIYYIHIVLYYIISY